MRPLLLLLVAAAVVVASAEAAPRPVTESSQLRDVRARLTYVYDPDAQDFRQTYSQLRLVIERAGKVAVDRVPQRICPYCATWPGSGGSPGSSSVRVADLDRDGEPVVLLDLDTGGAHCCLYTVLFRYVSDRYTATRHDWGNPGYRFVDIGGDGVPEFVTGDDRFNYAFSCYACSAVPLRILRFAQGRFVVVTRRFPRLVRRDAGSVWRAVGAALRHRQDPAGLFPAYLADESMVGRSGPSWERVRRVVARPDWPRLVADPRWRHRARYLAAVRRFLLAADYGR